MHDTTTAEVIARLETDAAHGLTGAEAERRLRRDGANVLPRVERRGALIRVLLQFHNPLIYTLLVAAAATYAVGEPVDASVIVGVVLANAAIGSLQESRAERALDSLASMISVEATVRRDGCAQSVSATQLVPGDVVLLEPGDKISADLRLLRHARDRRANRRRGRRDRRRHRARPHPPPLGPDRPAGYPAHSQARGLQPLPLRRHRRTGRGDFRHRPAAPLRQGCGKTRISLTALPGCPTGRRDVASQYSDEDLLMQRDIPLPTDLGPDPEPLPERFDVLMAESQRRPASRRR
jgi:hypothetical protein